MILEAIHYEGGIHVQDEFSQQVVREVGNLNVIDLKIANLLNQSRFVELLEEDMNLVLCLS